MTIDIAEGRRMYAKRNTLAGWAALDEWLHQNAAALLDMAEDATPPVVPREITCPHCGMPFEIEP
jgi:hypothetical protein